MIAWLEYFAIPIAFLYQVFVFEDIPGQLAGVGASLTLVGCMLPALHEMVMIVLERKRTAYDHGADSSDDDEYLAIESNDSGCYSLGAGFIGFDEEKSLSMSESDGNGRSTVLV